MTARVLLTCHDAGGSIPPVLALADALRAHDCEVTVLSQPSVRARAEARGCQFTAFSTLPDYDRTVRLEDQLERTVPALAGREVGDDLLAVARSVGADLLVVDANLSGALAAAETLSQPSAVLLHSMYATFVDTWFGELWPLIGDLVNATRTAFGAPATNGWAQQFDGHQRIVSVVPEALDAPVDERPPQLRHFGFLVPGAQAAKGPTFPPGDGPAVLVGLSTGHMDQGDLLQACIDALGMTGACGLVTTAGLGSIERSRVPPGVTVADFVPHAAVLPDADAMVTHAGLGSVAAALSVGVPLVCTPIDRDQPLNAERLREVGAGIRLEMPASAASIAAGIDRVLRDPSYRRRAQELAAASEAAGGATAAAADLLGLLV